MTVRPPALDDERRGRLLTAQLRGLLRGAGAHELVDQVAPAGAAAVDADSERWSLVTSTASLGAVALGHDAASPLRLVVAGDDELVHAVRRWAAASAGVAQLRRAVGPDLVEVPALATAELAGSAPWPAPAPSPHDPRERAVLAAVHDDVVAPRPGVALLPTAAGSSVMVRGLEVARFVADAGQTVLELGVGANDRYASDVLGRRGAVAELGAEPVVTAVAEVVDRVLVWRSEGSMHPFASLRLGHWLREAVIAHPELAGVAGPVERVADPAVPGGARVVVPAVATAAGAVVVCSVGIDPGLVLIAVDAWSAWAPPGGRLVVVLPEHDLHPAIRRSFTSLRPELGVDVQAVASTWLHLAP
jgi:hypothetical protein